MKKNGSVNLNEGFYIKESRSRIFIPFKNLRWIEAEGNYITLHLWNQQPRMARLSMLELQKQLPVENFRRVHKSFIVQMECVNEMHTNTLLLGTKHIPIGRKYKKEFSISFFEFIEKKTHQV